MSMRFCFFLITVQSLLNTSAAWKLGFLQATAPPSVNKTATENAKELGKEVKEIPRSESGGNGTSAAKIDSDLALIQKESSEVQAAGDDTQEEVYGSDDESEVDAADESDESQEEGEELAEGVEDDVSSHEDEDGLSHDDGSSHEDQDGLSHDDDGSLPEDGSEDEEPTVSLSVGSQDEDGDEDDEEVELADPDSESDIDEEDSTMIDDDQLDSEEAPDDRHMSL